MCKVKRCENNVKTEDLPTQNTEGDYSIGVKFCKMNKKDRQRYVNFICGKIISSYFNDENNEEELQNRNSFFLYIPFHTSLPLKVKNISQLLKLSTILAHLPCIHCRFIDKTVIADWGKKLFHKHFQENRLICKYANPKNLNCY